jgi:ABC-type uncharacterized transport system substrate-binding protein
MNGQGVDRTTRNTCLLLVVMILVVVTSGSVSAWWMVHRAGGPTRDDMLQQAPPSTSPEEEVLRAAKGKKALYINAYHPDYAWSDAEQKAAETVLQRAGVECRVVYMDTKRKNAAEEIRAAADSARKTIEDFKPDVVILQDDNPVKHVLIPWYRDTDLPFVFCGVNWDCGHYELPCRNVTGMLEVSLIPQILDTVRPLTRGTRIAMLGNDNETDRMEGQMIPLQFGVRWCAEHYVRTFDEWKTIYKELQTSADIIFWYGFVGIKNWSDEEAKAIVLENTRVITCSSQYYMAEFVLVGHMKLGEEQGDWAAHTALQILEGTPPASIPIAQNKNARITLNVRLAKQLNIVFPVDLIEQAELIR